MKERIPGWPTELNLFSNAGCIKSCAVLFSKFKDIRRAQNLRCLSNRRDDISLKTTILILCINDYQCA